MLATESAKAQGVSHLARFVRQDLFHFDLSAATVVALYISPGVMSELKPRLAGLKPGTRVVSHHFTLDEWEPDETGPRRGSQRLPLGRAGRRPRRLDRDNGGRFAAGDGSSRPTSG